MDSGAWTWLELVKIIISLLTPTVFVFIGIYIHRINKRFEQGLWQNQKLVEFRLKTYEELAPQFNTLFCYITRVGDWKDHTPENIIELKRKIDKKIYVSFPLFSKEFEDKSLAFLDLCFETYTGHGRNAKLKTKYENYETTTRNWEEKWRNCFSDNHTSKNTIRESYKNLTQIFAKDIGVSHSTQQKINSTGK